MATNDYIPINTVEEFAAMFGLPAPLHPLIGLFRQQNLSYHVPVGETIYFNLYAIVLKDEVKCTMRYGWRDYDFGKGLMNFIAPGQLVTFNESNEEKQQGTNGWLLVFSADLIRPFSLAQKMAKYRFFRYETNEALHVSEAERKRMDLFFENLANECSLAIDEFSQSIIVSQLDVLLSYSERFYKRQFTTRYSVENDVVANFERILDKYIDENKESLIEVNELASEMNMSAHYLSDYLRQLTGMTVQQHIHSRMIEKAKYLLVSTNLSAKEIAYNLGFEYPQYFNRLFKSKTGLTPLEFRKLS